MRVAPRTAWMFRARLTFLSLLFIFSIWPGMNEQGIRAGHWKIKRSNRKVQEFIQSLNLHGPHIPCPLFLYRLGRVKVQRLALRAWIPVLFLYSLFLCPWPVHKQPLRGAIPQSRTKRKRERKRSETPYPLRGSLSLSRTQSWLTTAWQLTLVRD